MNMVPQPRAYRARPMIPVLFMMLAVLACSIGGQQLEVTVTPGGLGPTLVAQSDVPDVEIRSPQDKSEVIIQTEVQVYVRAVDKVGVTRVEMRVTPTLSTARTYTCTSVCVTTSHF